MCSHTHGWCCEECRAASCGLLLNIDLYRLFQPTDHNILWFLLGLALIVVSDRRLGKRKKGLQFLFFRCSEACATMEIGADSQYKQACAGCAPSAPRYKKFVNFYDQGIWAGWPPAVRCGRHRGYCVSPMPRSIAAGAAPYRRLICTALPWRAARCPPCGRRRCNVCAAHGAS